MCTPTHTQTHLHLDTHTPSYRHPTTTTTGEVHCSWLPLGHIYERVNLITATHLGCSVGFYSGDVLMLLEDLQLLRPHLFPAVPRLWNRIYDRVCASPRTTPPLTSLSHQHHPFPHTPCTYSHPLVHTPCTYNHLLVHTQVRATIEQGNPLARRLFAAAYAQKQAALRAGDLSGGRMGPFWDRLVFSKIAARLGGMLLWGVCFVLMVCDRGLFLRL